MMKLMMRIKTEDAKLKVEISERYPKTVNR